MFFLPNMKVIWIYYLLLINPDKFMSGFQDENDLYTFPIP